MQSEKAKREVEVVTEAVGHAFECFDFVVDAFHGAGGDRLAATTGLPCEPSVRILPL